ncbi:MAG TPA: thermonuclease family protein [Vitreimonas sp.]|uniref:thermonuclease family protein n=1 Tax=Vitreimonas sp. TaxID=3069702 RepID=UPI002D27396B|nr:thermonuclease family protein [Vitreimonas sp.]HYD88674.1 thermonuclease family protein [Vitreimonas sp.]
MGFFALALLAACGPQIGELERGEESRVARAYNGDTLELESGLRVFLAEVDAPQGEADYAAQAQGELEALALHREVLLAYGGAKRWVGRPREGEEAPREAAIAHVFVRSEGGRWFWLQHELVSRGAAYVRPRRDNHARTDELLEIEALAREAERGLWAERAYRAASPRSAARTALEADATCLRGDAPYRIVEGRIADARVFETRASLAMDGAPAETPFALVVFGENFSAWEGPPLASLTGSNVRARGPLGVYRGEPQLCLEHASQLEVLAE